MTSEHTPFRHLQAVVFDWAGTIVDHGCMAPAIVFQEIFRQRGVPMEIADARGPMGMSKREHIATLTQLPQVQTSWREQFGRDPNEDDVDAMYSDFLPLQKATLQEHSDVIPDVADAVKRLKSRGLRIGSSTGYTRELMEVVQPVAARQSYEPDAVFCADDVPTGRPAPWLLFENAQALNTYPLWRVVKVDDTPVGIEAARNAGCWSIGVSRTGNGVGLSVKDWESLSETEQAERLSTAERVLRDAGADYLVETVAEIEPIMNEIEARLDRGHRPN